jgi:hypothetical protein
MRETRAALRKSSLKMRRGDFERRSSACHALFIFVEQHLKARDVGIPSAIAFAQK